MKRFLPVIPMVLVMVSITGRQKVTANKRASVRRLVVLDQCVSAADDLRQVK